MALARERAAEEAEGPAFTEADVVALDTYGEAPPTTRDAMFAIMRDRLEDIDDLLLQDVSPREAWANISKEKFSCAGSSHASCVTTPTTCTP